VERLSPGPMTEMWVKTAFSTEDFALGESVAIDGACLTVVEKAPGSFRVQATMETLRRTTLAKLRPGSKVNLERALRLSDRLGGHLVQGHVDAVAQIVSAADEGGSVVLTFSLPSLIAPWLIEKGSVAVDGVSLTVNTLDSDHFSVALIPETQTRTALALKGRGDAVNLEADMIGKYVVRLASLRTG
jgi:riboflavin synthase